MSYFFSLILFVYTKTMLAGSPGFQSPEQVRNESMGPPQRCLCTWCSNTCALWRSSSHYYHTRLCARWLCVRRDPRQVTSPPKFKNCAIPVLLTLLITHQLMYIAPPFFRANATWEERFMAENKLSSLGSRQKHERRRTRSRGEQRNQASWAETAISAHAH